MTDVDQIDYAERVRMALAEAGYPGALVTPDAETAGVFHYVTTAPRPVAWRAFTLAQVLSTRCLACFMAHPNRCSAPPCLVPGEGSEDCGVER